MPISALERLRQLKGQSTTSTPNKKSALERLRELKGVQNTQPVQTVEPPKPETPIRLPQAGNTQATQRQNIFNKPLEQKDFNVPEEMRTPAPQPFSLGQTVKSVVQPIADFAGRKVVDVITKPVGGVNSPVVRNLLPEKLSTTDLIGDLAKATGMPDEEVKKRIDALPDIAKQEISLRYAEDPKKALGQLVSDATVVYSGSAASGLSKIAYPFIRGMLLPAVAGTEGAVLSAGSAAGETLQKGGTFKEAIGAGLDAAPGGFAFGAALSPLGAGLLLTKGEQAASKASKLQKAQQKIVAKEEKVVQKADDLMRQATDVRSKRLNDFKESTGKTISKTMVDQQLGVKKTKNGYLDATELTDTALKRVKSYENIKKEAFKTRPEAIYDIDEVANSVIQKIDDQNSPLYEFNPETAQSMKEDILSYVDAFRKRSGTSKVNVQQLDELKKGAWQTGYDQLRPTKKKAARIFGNEAKERIEKTFEKSEFGSAIKEINKNEGELLALVDAFDVKGGKGLHGKVVRGGVLGKNFTQLLGGYIGSSIPVPVAGPIGGAYLTGKMVDYMLDPGRLTNKALRQLQKNGIMPKYTKDLKKAQQWLKSEQGKAYFTNKMKTPIGLPAPKPGSPQFSGGAIPENPNAIVTPYKQPTKVELPARKIGNQSSEMKPSIQKQMLDEQAYNDYKNSTIQDVRKEMVKEFADPQLESQYNNFVNLLKDRKLAFLKEKVQSGDVDSLVEALKNVKTKSELIKLFYSQEMNADEVLDLFRERLTKENPDLLIGKTATKNLGIPSGKELTELFAGAPMGFEEYTDKDGKKKYRINPEKAVAFMALSAGLTRPQTKKILDKVSRNLLPDDRKILVDFVDTFKSGKRVSPELETDARYFLEGIGINPDMSNTKVANTFLIILDSEKNFNSAVKAGRIGSKKQLEFKANKKTVLPPKKP